MTGTKTSFTPGPWRPCQECGHAFQPCGHPFENNCLACMLKMHGSIQEVCRIAEITWPKDPEQLMRDAAPDLYAALEFIEDYLSFHEGSEHKLTEGGEPVVWINASAPDGDLQIMLAKARQALAKARPD